MRASPRPVAAAALALLAAGLASAAEPMDPAIDRARERALAEALVAALTDGEAVWLGAQDDAWLGLLLEAHGKPQGGVVLLHELGRHPDWPEVIRPLRTGLAVHGWTTLAVQLPLLASGAERAAYGATVTAALARVRAGVERLRGRGLERVALVGHGLGALLAVRCAAAQDACGADAAVAVSLPSGGGFEPPADVLEDLARARVPVLDVYGSRDLFDVHDAADRRAAAGAHAGAHYRQLAIDGADHEYTGLDELLLRRVRGWLERTLPAGAGGE